MRLWTIHPKYLDAKGLVALWREGLLAKNVLENKTKGYRNHPQLNRFKSSSNPIMCINNYLHYVCDDADKRGYSFDRSKLVKRSKAKHLISVTSGQIKFEWAHLQKKLDARSPDIGMKNSIVKRPRLLPLFQSKKGPVEDWEII